jgi:hypothetical protein
MLFKYQVVIFVFLTRFLYDMVYLYKDCLNINIEIIFNSLIHCFIFTLVATGWFLDIKVTFLAAVIVILIQLLGLTFGGCVLTLEANKICNNTQKHTHYIASSTLYTIICIILFFLYATRFYYYFKG